jgi:nucleoid-associated protein YgaU
MTALSTGRVVALSLAVVAMCGTAVFFGMTNAWREPLVSTTDATAAPPAASGVREERSPALATAQAEANALAAELAVPASPGSAEEPLPAFDIARIERTGEAVIAGRAAPGAVVELLRNGERHDQAVADASGQFAMVPPRLPPGAYELTLRSRLSDGTVALSKQGVAVAANDIEPTPGAVRSQAEVSLPGPETTGAIPLPQDHDSKSSQARRQPPLRIAKEQDGAAPLSDGGSSSAGPGPRISTRVVSRGDSLWRISRITYGEGTRYVAVYMANRAHIRDPNRIFPGQIVVLPTKAR